MLNTVIGSGGILTIEAVSHIPTGDLPVVQVGKLIVQLFVAIVTVWQMFRKPKEKN